MISELWAFWTSETTIWLLGVLLAGLAWLFESLIGAAKSREGLIRVLEEDGPVQRYRQALTGMLDWIDSALSRETMARGVPDQSWRAAWTPETFNFSLSAAIIYPAVVAMAFWLGRGQEIRLGEVEILAATPWFVAAGSLVLIAVTLGLSVASQSGREERSAWREIRLLGLAALVSVAGAFLVVWSNAEGGAVPNLYSTALAVSICSAISIVCAGAMRGASAFLIVVLFAAAVTFFADPNSQARAALDMGRLDLNALRADLGGALGLAIPIGGALLLTLVGAVTPKRYALGAWAGGVVRRAVAVGLGAFVGAFVGMGALSAIVATPVDPLLAAVIGAGLFAILLWGQAISDAFRALGRAVAAPGPVYLLYALALGAVLIAVIDTASRRLGAEIDVNTRILFLLFGLIPLVNAVFDFASIGLTRYALRRSVTGERSSPVAWSLFDIATAVLCFFLLGAIGVLVVHLMNELSTRPILDFAGFFDDVRGTPGDYQWLFYAFLSTLIPTALHAVIACFSFLTLLRGRFADSIAGMVRLAPEEGLQKLFAVLLLTVFSFLSVLAPLIALSFPIAFFAANATEFGRWLADLFEGFALWLEAARPLAPLLGG